MSQEAQSRRARGYPPRENFLGVRVGVGALLLTPALLIFVCSNCTITFFRFDIILNLTYAVGDVKYANAPPGRWWKHFKGVKGVKGVKGTSRSKTGKYCVTTLPAVLEVDRGDSGLGVGAL